MSSSIIYKTLFEVKILHHYFLNKGLLLWDKMTNQEEKDEIESNYDIRGVLEIKPSSDCKKILDNYNCIFRRTSFGISICIKAKTNNKQPIRFTPLKPLDKDLTFRFLIRLNDLNFMNYTALPLKNNKGKMFVFKNYTVSTSINFPSLNSIPPVYEPEKEYMPGDILFNQATTPPELLTALVKTTKNTFIEKEWLKETYSNYANVNDRFPVVSGFFLYKMKEANTYPIATINTFSGNTIEPKMEILPGDFYTLQVDMRNFPPGFYSINIVNDSFSYSDDITFYLLRQNEIPLGLIEIKVKSDQAVYDLTNLDYLRSPTYELRFRNRLTHWRYVGQDFDDNSVTENPLPLTRLGLIKTVKVKDKHGNYVEDLPNPSVTMIRAEALTETSKKRFISEIYINKP